MAESADSASDPKARKLKEFYRANFPGLRMHHLIPRSRGGPSSYFTLFPWTEKSHDAWHRLFFNMTIQEVWERLDEIHAAIHSDADIVISFWVECCTLFQASPKRMKNFEEQKRNNFSRPISVLKLQKLWWDCFKSDRLEDARTLMLYMVMFMVFGSKMTDPESSISPTDTELVLSKVSYMSDYRRWAVSVCFNYGVSALILKIGKFNTGSL